MHLASTKQGYQKSTFRLKIMYTGLMIHTRYVQVTV